MLKFQAVMYKSFKLKRPPIEDDLKILKVEYFSNHCIDHDLWVLRGTLEGNSEEISSVALLSQACLFSFNEYRIAVYEYWILAAIQTVTDIFVFLYPPHIFHILCAYSSFS